MLPKIGVKSYKVGHLNINKTLTILYYKNLYKVSYSIVRTHRNPDKQRVFEGWRLPTL